MKIIAEIPGDEFLIKLNVKELSNLLDIELSSGQTLYNTDREVLKKAIITGSNVEMNELYKASKTIKNFIKTNHVQNNLARLQQVLDALKPMNNLLEEVNNAFETSILNEINKK